MDYELIYYTAGRTAEVERVLDKNLSQMGLSHSAGEAATTACTCEKVEEKPAYICYWWS